VARRRSPGGLNISDLAASASLQALFANPAAATQPPAASTVLATAQQSPAVQAQSLLNSADSVLFSSLGGNGSTLPDLSGLTATAQAYSLYTDPGMLQQLATGNAAGSSGSAPSTAAPSTAAVAQPISYAFNPFDQASWWTDPNASLGNTVDAAA
jgi:hypothetical protein